MRTLAIYLEITEEMLEALDEITMNYMTFIDLLDDCLTITARQEDMSSIERILAPFV